MDDGLILQQAIGGLAMAVLAYGLFEALLRWSRWM